LLAGALKVIVACPFPAVALPTVGAPGTPMGVTLPEGADGGPMPTLLVAATVKVYATPFDRPVMVTGLAKPEAVLPPGFAVTV
jgi:hypothetical protein